MRQKETATPAMLEEANTLLSKANSQLEMYHWDIYENLSMDMMHLRFQCNYEEKDDRGFIITCTPLGDIGKEWKDIDFAVAVKRWVDTSMEYAQDGIDMARLFRQLADYAEEQAREYANVTGEDLS